MATITLRNVPEELCEELKASAARNRRSLNQEAIIRLMNSGNPKRTPEETVEHLRRFRASLPDGFEMDDATTRRYIREGRE